MGKEKWRKSLWHAEDGQQQRSGFGCKRKCEEDLILDEGLLKWDVGLGWKINRVKGRTHSIFKACNSSIIVHSAHGLYLREIAHYNYSFKQVHCDRSSMQNLFDSYFLSNFMEELSLSLKETIIFY